MKSKFFYFRTLNTLIKFFIVIEWNKKSHGVFIIKSIYQILFQNVKSTIIKEKSDIESSEELSKKLNEAVKQNLIN